MNKILYPKLAVSNVKRNNKTYIPYIITCICTIVMFYNMYSLSLDKAIMQLEGAESIQSMLSFGTKVIGIFSAVFLFYTNSFLMKRRKKELGIYQVLGMEKIHLAKVLFFETIFIFLISVLGGLSAGIALNKLMYLLLLKILNFSMTFEFTIKFSAIIITLLIFTAIFFALLFSNLFQIHMSNPINLLKDSQAGEKEPKTNYIFSIIGIISLSAGYGISVSVKSPIQAINLFFLAVILVMIGTYTLFISGSILLLKLLRKSKNFYYKAKNFAAVSGMLYRMKQNAVGLANICILSSAVLVMISTTLCLYIGKEDLLNSVFPNDIYITFFNSPKEYSNIIHNYILDSADEYNVVIDDLNDYKCIYSITMAMLEKNNFSDELTQSNSNSSEDFCNVTMLTAEEYNRTNNKSYNLGKDEILLYSLNPFENNTIILNNKEYKIKEHLDDFRGKLKLNSALISYSNNYIIVMPNETEMNQFKTDKSEDKASNIDYHAEFNIRGNKEDILKYTENLQQKFTNLDKSVYIESRFITDKKFYTLYGGLFFLGIFLGLLFLMATVLIIYYKQVSEGYDDRNRFSIMQKVGMSKKEIQYTIRSQILIIFFLPLVTAIIHIAFAFPVLAKLLSLMYLTNIPLLVLCTIGTIGVFASIYTIVYILTARAYYKIVENQNKFTF